MAARVLTFAGRRASARDYHWLKAAPGRLQPTTIAVSLGQIGERRLQRFFWIDEWAERTLVRTVDRR
jgi:plasmid replication initiation protein